MLHLIIYWILTQANTPTIVWVMFFWYCFISLMSFFNNIIKAKKDQGLW